MNKIRTLLAVLLVSCLFNTAQAETKPGQYIDDSLTTAKVKKAYLQDSLLNPNNIKVETNHNGEVKLSGLVDSQMQYQQALILAENLDDVKKVDSSDLKVVGSHSALKDSMTTAKLKSQLIKEKLIPNNHFSYARLSVEVNNGVVYMTGEVENQETLDKVLRFARSYEGIKDVKYNISVAH